MTAFRDFGRPRFTPRERLDASDPSIRTAQHSTVDIALADGESYDLGGFVQGTWLLTWDDGCAYAEFKTCYDASDNPEVKIMSVDVDVTAAATVTAVGERRSAAENVGVEDGTTGNSHADDTVYFTVQDGSLVLVNGTGANGNARVFELVRMT